jgi:hypothetical protein
VLRALPQSHKTLVGTDDHPIDERADGVAIEHQRPRLSSLLRPTAAVEPDNAQVAAHAALPA